MQAWRPERQAAGMTPMPSNSTATGRSLRDPAAVVRQGRRLVGFERHYQCSECGQAQRSWTRLSACQGCGEPLTAAVVRRLALAG